MRFINQFITSFQAKKKNQKSYSAAVKRIYDSSFDALSLTCPQISSEINGLASREQKLKNSVFTKKKRFSLITFDLVKTRH